MEPINPTAVMFDESSNYPEEIYRAFAPVQAAFDLTVLGTEGVLADGRATHGEIEAILHANYYASKLEFLGSDPDTDDPKTRRSKSFLISCVTALMAIKIRDREIYESTSSDCVKRCLELFEYIAEDERLSKKEKLAALTQLKDEVTKKLVTVRGRQIKPFKFLVPIERYADRENKDENPKDFLIRVYGVHISRGCKPAHVRYEDENFYDNLHVWCSRNKVDLKGLFLAEADPIQRRLTGKQKLYKKAARMRPVDSSGDVWE